MNTQTHNDPTLLLPSPTAAPGDPMGSSPGTTPTTAPGTTSTAAHPDWRATAQEILDRCAVPEHVGWAFRDDNSGSQAKEQTANGVTEPQTSELDPVSNDQAGHDDTGEDHNTSEKDEGCDDDDVFDPLAGFDDLFEEDDTPLRTLARRYNPRLGRLPRVLPLLTVLQLARRFGSIAQMRAHLASQGEIVLLATGMPQNDDILVKVLSAVLTPPGQSGSSPAPLIRTLDKSADQTGQRHGQTFSGHSQEMRDALEIGRPILLVAGCSAGLSKDLRTLAPSILALPPLDELFLHEMLRILYPNDPPLGDSTITSLAVSGRSNHPHLDGVDTGVTDADVARLRPEDLILAFRAPTATDAVARLTRTLAPSPDTPARPGLAEFPLPTKVRSAIDQLLADLDDWRAGHLPWHQVSRGLLLDGPPGSGKTEIPRLIARDAKIAVHATSLSRLQSTGARSSDFMREMHRLFQKATEEAPSIVFIDELDAFGDRGRPQDHNSSYTDNIVTGLLECLDGFEAIEGVVIIAATNHLDKIDAALKRPGRFDQHLTLGAPVPEQIPQAFRWHLGDDLADEDLIPVLAAAIGMSGAEIARSVRSARATARAAGRVLSLDDLVAAIAETHPPLTPALRYRIAVHEAGHAVVTHATGRGRPRLLALHAKGGWADSGPKIPLIDRADIETELAVLLAGRAAETLILGAPGSGSGGPAASDLARATILAAGIEISFGLGKKTLWRAAPQDALAQLNRDPALRHRVQAHLNRAEAKALRILRGRQDHLERVASALADRSLLTGTELDALLQGAGPEPD